MDEDRFDVDEHQRIEKPSIISTLEEEVKRVQKLNKKFTKEERLSVISNLHRRGIFQLRNSVPTVADYFGISRYTVYNYL